VYQNLAPGVYIQAADPQVRALAPARTDVAAFVGIAERGPVTTPTRVTSFAEFTRTFGTFLESGYLSYAVNAFFENGGIAAWIVRATAPPAGTTVTSAIGQRLSFATPLALLPGTVVALEQPAAAQQTANVLRHVVDADPAGMWIDVDAALAGVDAREQPPIDTTLPVLLSTGGVSATTTLAAINGSVAAGIVASSPGSWGNQVAVRIMLQTFAQTMATGAPLYNGQQIPVSSVARFARGTFVRVRQGIVPDEYHVVCDIDPVNRTLVLASNDPGRSISAALNVPLSTAFSFTPAAPAVTVEALALDVVVLEGGAVVETYAQCSPLDVNGWNAQLGANNSRIAIVPGSLQAPTLDPTAWPQDVDAQYLWGGTDGTRMLGTGDLLGGLATLSGISEPTLIAIPDACAPAAVSIPTIPPPMPPPACTDPTWLHHRHKPKMTPANAQPVPRQATEGGPGFGESASAIVAQGLVEFCDQGLVLDSAYPPHPSFRFALVDVPNGVDPVGFRQLFDASRAAIHYPWAGVYDPLGAPGTIRFVPPSGHVAGAFAGMDIAVGAFRSAANTQLEWIASLETSLDAGTAAVYNNAQVNCILALPNRGLRIFGARTLASNPDWLFIPVRRLVSMIESSILVSMRWAVFEPNNATTRALVRRSCTTLLQTLWESGAFAGTSADQAYQVICDGRNNPESSQALGQLFVDIAVAPVRPAEYVIFRVGQQQGVLEVFEGAAA
jgi:uncharacterized protein